MSCMRHFLIHENKLVPACFRQRPFKNWRVFSTFSCHLRMFPLWAFALAPARLHVSGNFLLSSGLILVLFWAGFIDTILRTGRYTPGSEFVRLFSVCEMWYKNAVFLCRKKSTHSFQVWAAKYKYIFGSILDVVIAWTDVPIIEVKTNFSSQENAALMWGSKACLLSKYICS